MDFLAGLLESVRVRLAAAEGLEDVRILPAYPGGRRPQPVGKPLLLAGIGAVTLEAGALGDYLGSGQAGERFGRRVRVELVLDLLLPPTAEGAEALALAEVVCDRLLLAADGLLDELRWEEMGQQGTTGALGLRLRGTLGAYLAREEASGGIEDIIIRRKG